MGSLDDEIDLLREQTAHNRAQFLRVELQSCRIAIERAFLELSLGYKPQAQQEFEFAKKGVDTIERFLYGGPEPLPDIEAKILKVKGCMESLRHAIETHP